jgi:DNA invertase Pin-like site-specific DNA recombinase
MLKRRIDLSKAIDVALYGRMSSEEQNPRSPDQQFDDIGRTMHRLNRPWHILAKYRDDAISGRLVTKRSGLMQLVSDIESGRLKVQAILVHTYERWGRDEELDTLRRRLWKKYQVLLLTADSEFCDPTTPAGRALSQMEQTRAIEANNTKALDVLRGKWDAAMQKHWPGGPPPFGMKLKYIMNAETGRPEVDYAILEIDPDSSWIIVLIYRIANRFEYGTTRIAQLLNKGRKIPAKFKPFYPESIGYWLDNPIYRGELLWAKYCTGVIDDSRILDLNPVNEQLRVPDFCPPTVSDALWESVHELRQTRREDALARRKVADGGPRGSGLVLKHMLTNIVRCHECGGAMAPVSSGSTDGRYHYVHFHCPRQRSGVCPNAVSVREDRLQPAVFATLRHRIPTVPVSMPGVIVVPPSLAALAQEVRQDLSTVDQEVPDHRPAIRDELARLAEQRNGWLISLGNPKLSIELRQQLQQVFDDARDRIQDLEQQLAVLEGRSELLDQALNMDAALQRVRRLHDALDKGAPTRGNLELSQHIEQIEVFADGRILMHTCRLGIFDGVVELVRRARGESRTTNPSPPGAANVVVARPRTRRRLRPEDGEGEEDRTALQIAQDPMRFAGLDSKWFWVDSLEMPQFQCWSQSHAAEVAAKRAENPKLWTIQKLALHFGVARPTIRSALARAAAAEAQAPGGADAE